MSKIHVCNVVVCNNPAPFLDDVEFEITFDCIETLLDDLQWKIIYVGSAETEEHDQVLDTVFVGPVYEGRHRFLFKANPPNTEKLPKKTEDIIGLTLIMLTCAYRSKEFIRIGYYVNIQYTDEEVAKSPPEQPDFSKMKREIIANKSRVTKFTILWDDFNPYQTIVVGPPSMIRRTVVDDEVIDLEIVSNNDQNNSQNDTVQHARNKKTNKTVHVEEELVDEEEKKKFVSSLHDDDEVNEVSEIKDDNIMIIHNDEPMIIQDDSEDKKEMNISSSSSDASSSVSNKENKLPNGSS